MKILFGMPSTDSWGGPISSEPPFVKALRDSGHEVTEEVYVYGDKETATPLLSRFRRVWSTAFRFRKLLKRSDFDIVHLNSAFDFRTILRDSFSLFVMGPRKGKVFIKLHGSEAPQFFEANFAVRFLIRYIEKHTAGFGVHTSEEIKDFKRLGFPAEKLYQIKNAIPEESVRVGYERIHKQSDDTISLLFVSRFVAKKGLLETIEAVSVLKNSERRIKLVCVGAGELLDRAESKTRDMNLTEDVEFTGYIPESEVTEQFYSNDILVFPTRFGEGFPNVFFKALAAGMPVVATRFRAAGDFLEGEKNCLFCEPDPTDIAAKIEKLIDNRELRESMSAENREFGQTLLPDNIAKEFLAVYRSIVE